MIKPLIFFTDFHAHIFEDYAKPDPEYVNDRFRAQMETLEHVFHLARHHEADLVFGGDMFHKRSKIEDVVFNGVYDVFAKNSDVTVHLIRGNHDSKNNTTDSPHWLNTFKYLPNTRVYATPDLARINGYTLFGVPYSDDVAYLKSEIERYAQLAKGELNVILVAHIGVDGAETGRYSHRLEGAFTVGDLFPDCFKYVALGHYHKRQFLAGTDNVFYGGNTIQTSFADEGQDKGVFLLDWKNKPQFIPINNKQFITLEHIPQNVQEIVDNNYVRFILPKDQAQEVAILKDESDNIRIEVKKEYKVETRINIGMESTEEEIVKAYTKDKYPHVTQLALDILAEAKAL